MVRRIDYCAVLVNLGLLVLTSADSHHGQPRIPSIGPTTTAGAVCATRVYLRAAERNLILNQRRTRQRQQRQ